MISIKYLLIGIIGFILTTLGFFYVIVYSNLFTFGYSLKEYFLFMLTKLGLYSLILGLILIFIALIQLKRKEEKK